MCVFVCVCVFWLVGVVVWLVGWCCVVLCVVSVSVSVSLWRVSLCLCLCGKLKNLRVYVQNGLRVYVQNVPVYTGTTHTCVSTCARGVNTHCDVLNVYTESVLNIHTGRGVARGERVSVTHQHQHTHTNTPTEHATQEQEKQEKEDACFLSLSSSCQHALSLLNDDDDDHWFTSGVWYMGKVFVCCVLLLFDVLCDMRCGWFCACCCGCIVLC